MEAKARPFRYTSRDWFGKASAGLVAGFFLTLGISGLYSLWLMGGVSQFSLAHQFSMWLMPPILTVILSVCFLFRSGLQAWCCLGIANAVVWSLLFIIS